MLESRRVRGVSGECLGFIGEREGGRRVASGDEVNRKSLPPVTHRNPPLDPLLTIGTCDTGQLGVSNQFYFYVLIYVYPGLN